MKRFYHNFVSIALSLIIFVSIAWADSILDYLKYVENADVNAWSFWYTSSDSLAIKNVWNDYIDVESPVVKDWSKNITSYVFSVSTARAYERPVAYRCFDDVTINGNKFSVELDTKWLDSSNVYYLYAIPIQLSVTGIYNWICTAEDVTDFISVWIYWDSSSVNGEDPCFKINGWIYWEWSYCENHNSSSDKSSSNNVNIYSIRNVSHTYDWKNIKLTRESLTDTRIEIFLWDENNNTYEKIGNANSDDRSFTFTARYSWDHIVKFKPTDGSQEINYTAHYIETSSPSVTPATTTVKPVVVWPKENILLIIFGTFALYIIYRLIAKRKS